MILTKAEVPYEMVARERKGGGFRDSYAWHKRVWEAFPDKQPTDKRDFLTRLDDTGEHFRLLILSPQPPVRPGWCPEVNWRSKSIPQDFYGHSAYRFSLLANPTRRRVVRDAKGNRKKNGQRVPVGKRDDLIHWIEQKASQHGFVVHADSLKTVPRPRQHFLISRSKTSGTHSATEFIGRLEVSDRDRFTEAATRGIGSAKAFGFGMLCLHPLPS